VPGFLQVENAEYASGGNAMADQGEALRLTRAGQMAWERNERDGYASLFADDAVWTNVDGD
jgi:hypothetical protein